MRRNASLSSPIRALTPSLTGFTCSTCSTASPSAPSRRSCALGDPTLPCPSRRSVRATSHVSPDTRNRSTTRKCRDVSFMSSWFAWAVNVVWP